MHQAVYSRQMIAVYTSLVSELRPPVPAPGSSAPRSPCAPSHVSSSPSLIPPCPASRASQRPRSVKARPLSSIGEWVEGTEVWRSFLVSQASSHCQGIQKQGPRGQGGPQRLLSALDKRGKSQEGNKLSNQSKMKHIQGHFSKNTSLSLREELMHRVFYFTLCTKSSDHILCPVSYCSTSSN